MSLIVNAVAAPIHAVHSSYWVEFTVAAAAS